MNEILQNTSQDDPHWKKLHDGWVADFKFLNEQRAIFVMLSRKNPGSKLLHETIRELDNTIRLEQKKYKEQYGTRFSFTRING